MILQTEGASIATRSMSTSVDANGDFCFKAAAGTHTIQVPVGSVSCHLISVSKRGAEKQLFDSPQVRIVVFDWEMIQTGSL